MREVFQHELQRVREQLTEVASLVTKAIEQANLALLESDIQTADTVISSDPEIDELQNDLDERAIRLLARQQPVASDLRVVVGSLRMSASLERMGDLARHIAQLARLRYPYPVVPENLEGTFAELAELTHSTAQKVTEFLETQNTKLATEIITIDKRVDELHQSVFDAMGSPDWHQTAARTVDITLTSRYYERFADHAVSVATKVLFLITGDWKEELEPENPPKNG